ncbi:MAG: protein-L-isoaspartate(D-aspartate) O-methyltransferase [Candidatus Latescibacteria bacterium]|nr:protein-L-isoaspartate(D-aspartate) O-methyltransferase [Candidatus Latescibacterota bacterium]
MIIIPVLPFLACAQNQPNFTLQRQRMVEQQIKARGVHNTEVLDAMLKVPRHRFVPESYRARSYDDNPLPIGEGQTISQPYIVAFMTEALEVNKSDRILEIGTGSGYQAAVLAELAAEVYTIELITELGERAIQILNDLNYKNIHVKIGDGFKGWPEEAPFDAVIITAAPEEIPSVLVEQLKDGGRMIVPVGPVGGVQNLILGKKKAGRLETRDVLPVRFVPMVRGKE